MPITMKAIRMEKATLISTTNGMPLAPVAASTRPFSSDMKPTTWLTALRRVTIRRSPEENHGKREGEVLARQRISLGCHVEHDDGGKRDEAHADQHGQAHPDHRLDLAMDAEAHDHPVQRHRDNDCLEDERDRGGDEKVRRVLDVGLPGDREGEQKSVQREDVQKRVEAALIEHGEADEHEAAGQEVRDVEGEIVDHRLCTTKRSRLASSPSMKAAPRNSGTRKTRILAIAVSNRLRRTAPTASFAR